MDENKKAATPRQESAAFPQMPRHSKADWNSLEAQRRRLLEALRAGPVSTVDARRALDIMHPGGRVMELRRKGLLIVTHYSQEPTECGRLHRVGKYVLMPSYS